jgi:hypothetical protein
MLNAVVKSLCFPSESDMLSFYDHCKYYNYFLVFFGYQKDKNWKSNLHMFIIHDPIALFLYEIFPGIIFFLGYYFSFALGYFY